MRYVAFRGGRTSPHTKLAASIWLLVPQPVLTLAYLLFVRQGTLAPQVSVPLLLTIFPLCALLAAWLDGCRSHRTRLILCSVATMEILLALAATMVVNIMTAWYLRPHS